MTKKRFGTMAACLALVGAVAVGGTLALLTAQSNNITNTFTVGAGYNQTGEDPDFYLDEAIVKQASTATDGVTIGDFVEDSGRTKNDQNYGEKGDLIANAKIAKDPQFHIATDCKVDESWIVAKVSGFNSSEDAVTTLKFIDATDNSVNPAGKWFKVEKTEEGTYTYKEVVDTVTDAETQALMGNGVYIYNTALKPNESTNDLFQQLQVDKFVKGKAPTSIKIEGYAVENVNGASFEEMKDTVMAETAVDNWAFPQE